MIRALLPVTFALTLAITAGVLLARNGVFSGTDSELPGFSAASAGGSCCSKTRATETQTSLAAAESGCCSEKAGCSGGECPSQAAIALLNTGGKAEACSAGGCPFATASAHGKCCSDGANCCSGVVETCCGDTGTECTAGNAECCKEDAGACCSEGEKCCSKEAGQAESSEEVVAALAD